MRTILWIAGILGLAALFALTASDRAAAQARKTLDIYVVDVEGGNATLFVSPAGGSVLIDTGNLPPRPRCGTPNASWPRSRTPA